MTEEEMHRIYPKRNRRITHDQELAPDEGLSLMDYRSECRAANYPGTLTEIPPLASADLAAVARALVDAGWPPIRHPDDWQRLSRALRWFATGARTTGGGRR
ncbi:hypothetical protein HNR23_000789 [Nocardiopsis mwathae]|uniref:Uncharacterized protein n=1 Tax=Nocardiopsis mwathae TaxID=1472723 RepID=A0A7W9YEQ9_9ACTN|nr:hypothetical protein [Nocardiopsis mwathae]MBB6170729.1 hypothetical protein [Nocardiopsis mwathae]